MVQLSATEAKSLLDFIAGDADGAEIAGAVTKLTQMLEHEPEPAAPAGATIERIWDCKIGADLHGGVHVVDAPMRAAVVRGFIELTLATPTIITSGWGGSLTEAERAAHEDRLPDPMKVELMPSDAASVLHLLRDVDLECDLPEDTRGRLRTLQNTDLP